MGFLCSIMFSTRASLAGLRGAKMEDVSFSWGCFREYEVKTCQNQGNPKLMNYL